MAIQSRRCNSDEDYAKASLFVLENIRDIHPSFTTIDTVTLLYSYLTKGFLVCSVNENNDVVGAGGYYLGTPEENYQNKDVAFVDFAIYSREKRGTRAFVQGLSFLVGLIAEEHREVEHFRLAALSDNGYLCKLYGKFAKLLYTRTGELGEETVFGCRISEIQSILSAYHRI